jgi:OOP family OmpA-OmpF porin
MKNLNKIAIAISMVGCGVVANVHAQTGSINPSWYIAPSLGGFDPDTRFGLEKNGPAAALRFGKPLSESWDLQFGTSYARSRENDSRYQQNLLGADALYLFSRDKFRPFLLIGAGYEHDKLNNALGETKKTSPYLNAGVGAQMSINDQWSLQAEWRRVHGYLRNNAFNFDRSNNNYLMVGLNYAFDKPAPAEQPAPAPIPEPIATPVAPVPEAPPPRFEKYTLATTELFAFNSAELKMPQPKLDEIAAALMANPDVDNVGITGYADRLGSAKYNLKLSERRALAVKDYLVSKGVDAGRLNTMGKGKANPVVDCKGKKKRADLIRCLEPNRRVEIEQISLKRRVQ